MLSITVSVNLSKRVYVILKFQYITCYIVVQVIDIY